MDSGDLQLKPKYKYKYETHAHGLSCENGSSCERSGDSWVNIRERENALKNKHCPLELREGEEFMGLITIFFMSLLSILSKYWNVF